MSVSAICVQILSSFKNCYLVVFSVNNTSPSYKSLLQFQKLYTFLGLGSVV